ncbi:DUF559 domain-containing protein [Solwaraspora sp. WMMD1047]|uniref:DUF559 domain-containing protein n=1 Tax=Solwaraspora sp. WMMD1047 TaxID=3016102 RepID=UPI00241597D6|nr:DUF559 domain-containing protein [Solwaraspora sp. WMMD1047]MDG4833586.1 DUF559 domain-containing protein [Solwaraspora sp. WMMD1047]
MRLPRDDASALDWLLFEQAGVVTWGQAVAELGPSRVRHLLATGRWQRLCRGVLASGTGPLTQDAQWWVAVLAAGERAVLAGLTAALAGGLKGYWRRQVIDVLVPYPRHASRLPRTFSFELPAVKVRRTRHLPDSDLQFARPMRTTMARALVDAAQWAESDRDAQGMLAAGCQQRKVTPDEITQVLDRMPQIPRRTLIRRTVEDIAGGAHALSEIDFIRLCRRHGLPEPSRQERRKDGQGRNRYLDAYWRQWRLHVEIDGAHHMDARQWAADLQRQNEVWLTGDRILRFTAFDVRNRPDYVITQIRTALLAAGWRPPQ